MAKKLKPDFSKYFSALEKEVNLFKDIDEPRELSELAITNLKYAKIRAESRKLHGGQKQYRDFEAKIHQAVSPEWLLVVLLATNSEQKKSLQTDLNYLTKIRNFTKGLVLPKNVGETREVYKDNIPTSYVPCSRKGTRKRVSSVTASSPLQQATASEQRPKCPPVYVSDVDISQANDKNTNRWYPKNL
jgi:hypothetical protein